MTFYDSNGIAVAYSEDNENIYLYNGKPVAYLFNGLVYRFNGTQLGRFENGWVRDKMGYCVFFTENAKGNGPIKPAKHIKPIKEAKQIKPIKRIRHVPAIKVANNLTWSSFSGLSFFA